MSAAAKPAIAFKLPAEFRMLLLSFCEGVSEKCLFFEPDLQRELVALERKIIRIEVTDLDLQITILVTDGKLKLFEVYAGVPDTCISLDSVNAFRLFMQRGRTPVNVQLDIRGDIHTGQKIKQIMDEYQFDWNEKLSYFCGDVVAHQVSNGIRHLHDYLQTSVNSFLQTGAEYLVEEKQLVAHDIGLREFTDAVGRLRNDVDRAEARLQRLRRVL